MVMNREYETLQIHTAAEDKHAHWFNDTPERQARAKAKGYVPVLKDGRHVRKLVGPNLYAILMEAPKVKRNLAYFFALFPKMSAAKRAKLERMNQNIEEGATIKGWRPRMDAEYLKTMFDLIGKTVFIKRHGRKRWRKAEAEGLQIVTFRGRQFLWVPGLHSVDRLKAPRGSIIVQDYVRRDYRPEELPVMPTEEAYVVHIEALEE